VSPDVLKICLVLHEDNSAWIIAKVARRLVAHGAAHGMEVCISDRPSPQAHVNHWMSYAFANERHQTPTTMFVTHIDDPYKLGLVRSELREGVDVAICMSSESVAMLAAAGVARESLCFILPAHDGRVLPGRIVIGVMTRVYDDGRKRERDLVQLAERHSLDAFRFEIFGRGWERVVPKLCAAGAEVRYEPGSEDFEADYAAICAAIPGFDYYLYLGSDEGSLGTLDALAAGVPTITTPQGFHLDLPGGITHPITSYEEFAAVMLQLAAQRAQRIATAAQLTWAHFTARHAIVWRAVHEGRRAEIAQLLAQTQIGTDTVDLRTRTRFLIRALDPIRIRSALSHLPVLKPLRRWIKERQ